MNIRLRYESSMELNDTIGDMENRGIEVVGYNPHSMTVLVHTNLYHNIEYILHGYDVVEVNDEIRRDDENHDV